MSKPAISIQIPPTFRLEHEQAVIAYLNHRLVGRTMWGLAFEAFDILDQAFVIRQGQHTSFRVLYLDIVDYQYADSYIDKLLSLDDIPQQSPALWAQYAREIVSMCRRDGWQCSGVPETRLLLSYILYWWSAFTRGYAFEVEIYRDLQQSTIEFHAHNIRDRRQRYSASDLTVSGMAGDIKTSTYFVQTIASFVHDFYIVRLTVHNRVRTLVAFLQPSIWKKLNGDTVEATLDTVTHYLPAPVKIYHREQELVILEYTEWKQRILTYQGGNE